MSDKRELLLQRTLRGLVLALTGLTFAAIGAALFEQSNYEPSALTFSVFAFWMIAPGLVLWLHPKLPIGILWSALAWFGFLMAVNLPWPGATAAYLMTPVVVTLLLVLPISAALYKVLTVRADARAQRPAPPVARVVTRRRA